MKPNQNQSQSQSSSETLMITRDLARRARKLRKRNLSRAGAAKSARRLLEELRGIGMAFPGAAFEEPPCADCLETSLFLAENSLLDFERFLQASETISRSAEMH